MGIEWLKYFNNKGPQILQFVLNVQTQMDWGWGHPTPTLSLIEDTVDDSYLSLSLTTFASLPLMSRLCAAVIALE